MNRPACEHFQSELDSHGRRQFLDGQGVRIRDAKACESSRFGGKILLPP
jgi:hypothetical protein